MSIRVCGFLQNKDGISSGFLEQILNSMARVVDYIVVYDDASTEDVRPLYLKFDATVIYGRKPAFHRELFNKAQLLKVALQQQPEFLIWADSDTVLGRYWESRERTEETLENMGKQGIDLLHLHNLNLYRSEEYYRVDSQYNDLWHGSIWKNSGELFYQPVARLHQKQYPHFYRDTNKPLVASKLELPEAKLLHFGFASDEEVIRKYLMYKEHGQTGWALDRLADESTLQLEPADPDWFPTWRPMKNTGRPAPLDWERIRALNSIKEWEEVRHKFLPVT